MKIYFANILGAVGLERYLQHKINVLASFPSFPKSKKVKNPDFCQNLFIDSGAFGKEGGKVKLNSYIEFIKKYNNIIHLYANLDVIGNAKASWGNQIIMEKAGLTPLPVFHYGNDIKWLNRLVNKYEYIALGGLVPIATNANAMRQGLDYIWGQILNSNNPTVKVHGFGIQSIKLMKRYPWHSVDSSSTHIIARYGGIYTPWGTFKINPNVNSKEMEWQIKKPLQLKRIENFVKSHINGCLFKEAREQSKKGILIRCAISIHYITKELMHHKCSFQPNQSILKI